MRYSTIKRYRRKHKILGSLLLKNPVLVMGLDLPFVIATSTSLRNAAAISVQMLMIHMITMCVAFLVAKRLPLWLRAVVTVGVSTLVMVGSRIVIYRMFPGITETLGIYLYLMAVNGMTLLQSQEIRRKAKPGPVLMNAFLNVAGFVLVVGVVAVIREVFGNATLWGNPINLPFRVSGLLLPFGGFIIMAFVLAFAKFLNKRLLYLAVREAEKKEERLTRIKVISEEVL